jgi:hypothetical protein
MATVTIIYHVISAIFVLLCVYNIVKKRLNLSDFALYLVLVAPFVLRLLQIK